MINLFQSLLFQEYVALDTETTGLQPHREDTAFAVSIAVPGAEYYFEVSEELSSCLSYFFANFNGTLIMHNAKFDMGFFDKLCRGVNRWPKIHCSMAAGRLLNSDAFSLSLDNLGKELGYTKDDGVKKYLEKHKLFERVSRPGKKQKVKNYHFELVPREVMEPYAKQDAKITLELGKHQIKNISTLKCDDVLRNEMCLTNTFYQMEKTGIKIDREFVTRAWEHEQELIKKAIGEFETITNGLTFVDHFATLYKAFEGTGEVMQKTDKDNYCFDNDALKTMKHPLARVVQRYREAHNRAGTYETMLFYADSDGILYATAKQAGCVTGRVSYSDPPLQCMEKVEKDDPSYNDEFLIRRAFVPRENYFFVMMDFDQFEYRMMANYAKEQALIDKVKSGIDVHTATAEMMDVTRKQAKTINFMLLYGGGVQKLADALNISYRDAAILKDKYFTTLPMVKKFIKDIQNKIFNEGYATNWLGRRYNIEKDFVYKGPNYLIQGSCADWVKKAMNNIQVYLQTFKTRMLLQVHDEIIFECHESEKFIIPYLKDILESVIPNIPSNLLKYTVGVSYSYKSWQDKEEWK